MGKVRVYCRRCLARAQAYLGEMAFCIGFGRGIYSPLALAADTLRFHFANAVGSRRGRREWVAKPYAVNIGGQPVDLWLRAYGGDMFVLHEVFRGGFYRVPEALRDCVMTVMDLGAHIGLTTLFWTQYFRMARFVCVEADGHNVELLKKNVSWLGGRVEVVEGAIGTSSGEVHFEEGAYSWGGRVTGDGVSGRLVRCYTVEELMESRGLGKIDVLKVDIEGAEKELFSRENNWLERVGTIVVELHGDYSAEAFGEDVAGAGFKVLSAESPYGNRMIFGLSREVVDRLGWQSGGV